MKFNQIKYFLFVYFEKQTKQIFGLKNHKVNGINRKQSFEENTVKPLK